MKETGKVILEAFHYQMHPCNHAAKSIIDSKRYGNLLSTSSKLSALPGQFGPDNIRFQYKFGGGACLDLGYIFSSTMFFTGGDGKFEVVKAVPRLNKNDEKIDDAIEVDMLFHPRDSDVTIKCHAKGDLNPPKKFGILSIGEMPVFTADMEYGTITISK